MSGKSGLKFISPSHTARSSDLPVSISARCKLDSILCGLFNESSRAECSGRLESCRDLISRDELVECECADLILSDGRRGDCSETDSESEKEFCFVKSSPCVTRDVSGIVVEESVPVSGSNGLLHKSFHACVKRNILNNFINYGLL